MSSNTPIGNMDDGEQLMVQLPGGNLFVAKNSVRATCGQTDECVILKLENEQLDLNLTVPPNQAEAIAKSILNAIGENQE
jgi:hypothetical protein